MAKLPDNFVKAPAETSRVTTAKPADKPAGKEIRRKARRGDPPPPAEAAEAAEATEHATEHAAEHAHSVLVRLSPEEHHALSAACEALAAVGETVTIEAMIRKLVERWIAATRAATAAEPGEPAAPAPATPPRAIAAIRAQLRWLAEQPVRRWRALRQALQRWTHARAD
jgi:hypothetical protein